jgi:hypothetical protein
MIIQLKYPPSSVLIERRNKEDTGEEYVFITQIHNVLFTKLQEFESYMNETKKDDNVTKKLIDSHFVIIPLNEIKRFLENADTS